MRLGIWRSLSQALLRGLAMYAISVCIPTGLAATSSGATIPMQDCSEAPEEWEKIKRTNDLKVLRAFVKRFERCKDSAVDEARKRTSISFLNISRDTLRENSQVKPPG